MNIDNFSYFKYSLTGDLFDHDKNWGLANSVFATKILSISGLIDQISPQRRENLIASILNFSNADGTISDPFIAELSLSEKVRFFLKGKLGHKKTHIEDIKRAETRQSFAALYLLNAKPHRPFEQLPQSQIEIIKFLETFDWKTPWHAGSHFSHLLFFLKMNAEFFDPLEKRNKDLIAEACYWVMEIQSPKDGCWYTGRDTSLSQKINGAMKILTGLHAANIVEFPYPKKLIDTALIGVNDKHACDNFNIVYVLYACHLIEPEYKKDEIVKFLLERLTIYYDYYWPEYGGFSFLPKQANTTLYGKRITYGKMEPDIHGTIMFLWGIALIDKILNLGLNLKLPLN